MASSVPGLENMEAALAGARNEGLPFGGENEGQYGRWNRLDLMHHSCVYEIKNGDGKKDKKAQEQLVFVCAFCRGKTIVTPKNKQDIRQGEFHYKSDQHKKNKIDRNEVPIPGAEIQVNWPIGRVFARNVNELDAFGGMGGFQNGTREAAPNDDHRINLTDLKNEMELKTRALMEEIEGLKKSYAESLDAKVKEMNDKVEQLKTEAEMVREASARRFESQEKKIASQIKLNDQLAKLIYDDKEFTFDELRNYTCGHLSDRVKALEGKVKACEFLPLASSTIREPQDETTMDTSDTAVSDEDQGCVLTSDKKSCEDQEMGQAELEPNQVSMDISCEFGDGGSASRTYPESVMDKGGRGGGETKDNRSSI